MESYDLALIGAGSANEWIWEHVKGKKIAVIESKRIGGECPYVACIPSKAMLRSAHVRRIIGKAHELGAVSEPLSLGDPNEAFRVATNRRDNISSQRSDSEAEAHLLSVGAYLYRGHGRIMSRNRVGVFNGETLAEEIEADVIVIDTGSSPRVPGIKGLEDLPFWNSEDALSSNELPSSISIIGGGAIGCELADIYSAFGVEVQLLESSPHILPSEDEEIVHVLKLLLEGNGVRVLDSITIEKVDYQGNKFLIHTSESGQLESDKLIVATGRQPNVESIGLSTLGIEVDPSGIKVDEYCRVVGTDNVYAAGDVTGLAPFTHGAKYQAGIIVDHLTGGKTPADYSAIPRAVYCDPPVASVGRTSFDENESESIVIAKIDLAKTARALTDGSEKGILKLFADSRSGTLVGASAIGPNVDELISQVGLAIAAKVPVSQFSQLVHPFPTYSEALEPPLKEILRLL